ncbi:MAG: FG-GAP-like repeat-containing protein [Pyrinomonadaceae bacterium]
MKKRLSVLITVLVCAVSTFLFFLVPQEAQIVESGPGYDGAVQPEGGLLYYVNTTSDTIVVNACANGVAGCSLRGAIQVANTHAGIDGIEFDLPPNSVINLTQALPDVTGSVGITGPGANLLTVRRNMAPQYRIFNVTTTGTVTFSGLTISDGNSTLGGGIQNNSGTVNVVSCALTGNLGDTAGGIFNNSGTVNVTNSTFTGNSGTDAGYFGGGSGGGIYNSTGTVNVTNSIFTGNTGLDGGGIFNSVNGNVNVINSTFSGNQAIGAGGGICNDGTLNVTSSTISGNTPLIGDTPAVGGGIACRLGIANIKSSIIALNTGSSAPDVYGAFTSLGFNLIGKNDGSTGFTSATDQRGTIASPLNPMLDPAGPQNNGGLTRTIAVLSNSPAIDRGTSSGLTTDQRGAGFPRTVDNPAAANAPGGNGTDVGAFERGGKSTFDFDGDGKTDIGIFRPNAAGEWWINRSSTGVTFALQFGASTDRITPADYTGDGKTDIAFFRPLSGQWFVLRSEDFSFFALPFGTTGDIPTPADYDADGKADFALFRPSTSIWYISQSSGAPTRIFQFGITGDQPVVADYDGDGKADVGIFRPGPREWWIQRSTAGSLAMQFGTSGDKAVQGDYTGDGKTDVAIWRPSTGQWFIVRSEDSSFFGFPFGANGDVPAPGDYDGDGKFDPTVFRPSGATWFIARTTAGTQIVQFGAASDRPIPGAFVP